MPLSCVLLRVFKAVVDNDPACAVVSALICAAVRPTQFDVVNAFRIAVVKEATPAVEIAATCELVKLFTSLVVNFAKSATANLEI